MVDKEIWADSDISMTTAVCHSLLSRQCHDLYYPRAKLNGWTHSIPSDGDKWRTLEELEMIGYHTLCGQVRKQLSR